jgi:glucosyl-3-phosphoglycerate synthase
VVLSAAPPDERTTMRTEVSDWLSRRTYRASDFSAARLLESKHREGCRVSVVLPALDEEATVGAIIESIRCAFVERVPLVDEVVVMDSGSTDRTARVAADAGARVVRVDDVLPAWGHVPGKGEALWKSLYVTDGDLVVFVDSDLRQFDSRFVLGLLGPLITDPGIGYVKGLYDRPLSTTEGLIPTGGGRVTELTARPLLGALWPRLSGFVQPLSGEYAGRRRLLERVPFVSHYGVEFGLLVDLAELAGIDALAQVDLGTRMHSHQSDAALGRMAGQILQTALARCPSLPVPGDQLVQFVRSGADVEAVAWDVGVIQRPPMATVPEYRARRGVHASDGPA